MSQPERYLRWDERFRRRGRTQPLLWPVNVWTVLAPEPQLRLNVFQEGILGLIHAGLRDRTQIAQLLELDPELVAYILAHELQPLGFVDDAVQVTPTGLRTLVGEAEREPRLSQQFAFQDAWSGDWLPRVSRELPEVLPREGGTSTYPEFVLDRDSGKPLRPFVLPAPRQRRHGPPDHNALLQAWRQCEHARVRAAHKDDSQLADLESEDIELLGAEPMHAWVWCDVYVNEGDPQPWLVSDPWHLTPAARWLREALQARLHELPVLAGRIAHLLPDDGLESESPAQWLQNLEQRAELTLATMPHLHRPGNELMREHMGRVLRLRDRLELMQQDGGRLQSEDLAALAQESASLLEATVRRVLERWAWPADAPLPTWGNRREAAELLRQLPLAQSMERRPVDVLSGQRSSPVQHALRLEGSAFKALLFGALLCTTLHENHPLRDLPEESLQWDRLLILVDARNKASHASGGRLQGDEALEMARFAIGWHGQFESWFRET